MLGVSDIVTIEIYYRGSKNIHSSAAPIICIQFQKCLVYQVGIGLIWKVQFLKHIRFRCLFLCHLKEHNKSENSENLNKISHWV